MTGPNEITSFRLPATMAEVAKRAGVAPSTVSYVLSGKRPVSPQMAERVSRAIEELDYRPHRSARALASRRSGTLVLLLPSPHWLVPVQQTFVAGAAQATSDLGYALSISTSTSDPATMLNTLRSRHADGVILMETLTADPRIELLRSSGYPFALIGHTGDNTGIPFVDVNFRAAVGQAVDHLAELGHRTIALLNFSSELVDAGYTAALVAAEAFETATRAHGITAVQVPCDHPPEASYATSAALLSQQPACTAAITTGWQFVGLLAAARAAGLRVPDDLSIVSIIAAQFAEMMTPRLTGADWPAFDAGRLAAELLVKRLENASAPPHQITFSGDLVLRESTAAARQRLAAA